MVCRKSTLARPPYLRGSFSIPALKLLLLAAAAALLASAAYAQDFVTVRPEPQNYAWWLRADFKALHSDIRGIPVARISRDWCRATEFARDLFPPGLLVEDGHDVMAASKYAFSLEGSFDGTDLKQTALVGVYETCGGENGNFLLIIDSGTSRVRFLSAEECEPCFLALSASRRPEITIWHCMECDHFTKVRWSRARKRFHIVEM